MFLLDDLQTAAVNPRGAVGRIGAKIFIIAVDVQICLAI